MEKLVRIISQGALQQRNWKKDNGETVVISSVELVLSDGTDTFVGEVTDQKAIAIDKEPLSKEHLYGVQLKMTAREWKSEQTQQMVRATSIKILNIAAL
jgi:hypothetical protein